ncbi:hypothetical protein MNAN1_002255 [Malassezia nana]|uniref:RWD domain-containing protein n=1 Tax=Malassezia nana TaxID=180528 RepID=A0AAF0EK74_9BASI|nr:hypothetical protein MNAN1_002255 [Malassezia nana]
MEALIERLQDRSHWATEDDANSAEDFSQELIALQSIYDPDNVDLVYGSQAGQPVVIQVKMPLREGIDDWIKLQVELSITYPNCDTAPKMQLSETSEHDDTDLAHSDVLVERKSEFLGHAIRISSPDEIATITVKLPQADAWLIYYIYWFVPFNP